MTKEWHECEKCKGTKLDIYQQTCREYMERISKGEKLNAVQMGLLERVYSTKFSDSCLGCKIALCCLQNEQSSLKCACACHF